MNSRSATTRRGLEKAVVLLGRPWTLLIIKSLCDKPLRFNELAATLPGISTNLLTERLRTLTQADVVTRTPTATASTYTVTPRGRQLQPLLAQLGTWGDGLK